MSDQMTMDFGRGSDRVRTSDPDTSHAAAASLDDISEVQALVLDIHKAHPSGLTDEELLAIYSRDRVTAESSPRKRRCDLTKLGALFDSGERRELSTGRKGIVWKVR